jgi:hypothetical protein
MSDRSTRLAGLYALIAAGVAVLLAPLLALSYHSTAEGAEELEAGTVSAWSDPGRDLVGGLITWAAPERVYATFVQLFALLVPAIFLCARAVRARRPVAGRLERWGWRSTLFGYGLLSIGLLAAAAVLVDASAAVEGSTAYAALDAVFMALMLPGMAISVIGSSLLGIGLLRNRFQPRLTAGLLAVAFPALLVLSTLLGHNGIALLPVFVAWGAAGFQLWREGSIDAAQRSDRRGQRFESARGLGAS